MIYSVEDDQGIRDLVLYALRQSGYEAEGFAEGQAFQQALAERVPDLVLMDQMLPGVDGDTLLLQMRADPRTAHVPVIMLTAKTEEYYQLNSFRLGVDDYVPKPFSPGVLMARVSALLRRSGVLSNTKKNFGDLVIDDAARKVTLHGEKVDLTPKEYDMLNFLASNSGIALSREQILNSVWSFDYFGDLRTVDTHIKQLRSKLGDYADKICTVRGIGYRFEVEKDV